MIAQLDLCLDLFTCGCIHSAQTQSFKFGLQREAVAALRGPMHYSAYRKVNKGFEATGVNTRRVAAQWRHRAECKLGSLNAKSEPAAVGSSPQSHPGDRFHQVFQDC